MKPHFCFVMPWHISEGKGGGSEVQANMLANELAIMGFSVDYVCQSIHRHKEFTTEIVGNIKIHWLPNHSGKFQFLYLNNYVKQLNKISPDIIVQRMTSCVTGILGWYSKKKNKKFVWFCTDAEVTSKGFHVNRQLKFYREEKTKFHKRIGLFLLAMINDKIRNYGMNHVDLSICQNIVQQKELLKNFKFHPVLLRSGHIVPEPIISLEKRNLILWAGNLGSNKNPLVLPAIARGLKTESAQIIAIGNSKSKSDLDLFSINAPKNLRYEGHKSLEVTNQYFDNAAILLNTSLKEGFPNTFIQAWLRGIPVVTLGVDPDNIIITNKLGKVCSSVEEVSLELDELLTNPEYYKKISHNAIKFALSNHNIKEIANQFIHLLNNL